MGWARIYRMSPLIPIAKEDPPSSDELPRLPPQKVWPPQWPQKFDKATRTVGEYQCHNASNTKFRASSANSYSRPMYKKACMCSQIFFWLERATWKDKCTHTYKLKQKTNKQPLTNKHTPIHTQTHTYKFVCARILGCQIRVQIQEHTHGSTMCSQVRFAPGSQETVDKIMICAEVRGQCEPLYCENGCLVRVCLEHMDRRCVIETSLWRHCGNNMIGRTHHYPVQRPCGISLLVDDERTSRVGVCIGRYNFFSPHTLRAHKIICFR